MVWWLGLMSPDDLSKDLIGVAVFESKEHHIKNAQRRNKTNHLKR